VRDRVFTFWVSSRGGRPDEEELDLAERVLAAAPPDIPVLGWWESGPDPGLEEYRGVGLAGEYGKLTLGSDWQANLSVLSGVPVDAGEAARARPVRGGPPPLDARKVYLCFVVVDSGDAPNYWHMVQRDVWSDPQRGRIPIAWSLAPAAVEMMPSVMAWFFRAATPNDHFVLALSGAGYAHPYRAFMERTADPEAAWRGFLALTRDAMDRLGIRDVCLYTDAWLPFERERRDAVTRRFVSGLKGPDLLILGLGRDENALDLGPGYDLDGTLVTHVVTRWNTGSDSREVSNNDWLMDEILSHTPRERPAFLVVHPLSWSYYPSDLVSVLEQLGDDYVAVSPADLRALYRQAEAGRKGVDAAK
jgi:hypothetical protein